MSKKYKTAKQKKMSDHKHDETDGEDVIALLKADHKPLKKLIKVMKDTEQSLADRQEAFDQFYPLLTQHAKAEEKSLYVFLKEEIDMEEEGLEGDVEHDLAEEIMAAAEQTSDENLWSARVKVLAELVEHHIDEEEDEIFPEFKKNSDLEDRQMIGALYLEEKELIEAFDEDDTLQKINSESPQQLHH